MAREYFMVPRELNTKQKIFVERYLATGNVQQAAREAGYDSASAGAIGHQLLAHPLIAEILKSRVAEEAMEAREILSRLAEQAKGDISEFLNVKEQVYTDYKGKLKTKQIVELDEEVFKRKGYLIKRLYMTTRGPALEMYDAQHALELLGKVGQLFKNQDQSKELNLIIDGTFMELESKAKAKAIEAQAESLKDKCSTPDSETNSLEKVSYDQTLKPDDSTSPNY
jgi:hypothetical protein